MTYKNSAVALWVLVFSSAAHPQISTTIYGVLDVGVRSSQGLGLTATSSPSPSPGSTTAESNGVDRSGLFGFTGTEDVGSGYQAVFKLESDLYANTGSINPNLGNDKNTSAATTSKFFERQAFVGLATPFGQVLLGRQQSVIRDVIDGIDAIDGRFTGFNPNLQYTSLNSSGLVTSPATYYGSGDPGNGSMQRQDNLIKTISDIGPFVGTLAYSKVGTAGASEDGASVQAALTYIAGPLKLSGAYLDLNNVTDTLKLKAFTVGGRLTEDDWQLSANFGSNTADNTVVTHIKTDIYSVGTTYAASSAVDLTLGYYNVRRNWTNDVKPNAKVNRVIGFAEYKFSKNTLAYLELDYNKWGGDVTQFQGGAANSAATSGMTIGIKHQI